MKRKIKKYVGIVDKKICRGKLKELYTRYTVNKKKAFFGRKKIAVIEEPVSDMILMQYNANEFLEYQFFDIGVRVLAIENYYGQNDFGFELYKKMHTVGGNYGQCNQTEDYYKSQRKKKKVAKYGLVKEEHSIEQFKNLIESYEKNGYDTSSLIMADKNLLSMNGSHRIAVAIYRDQDFMNVEVHNSVFQRRRFNLPWFWENGFTRHEIEIIRSKTKEIISNARKKTGDYYFILYPPAYKYFDDITEDLRCYDNNLIEVLDYKDYYTRYEEFEGFVRAIYSFDSILPYNFARKMFYIKSASEIKDGYVHYRIIRAKIDNPCYRLKTDNGMPESLVTVEVKNAIRTRYKVKEKKFTKHYVGDYAHDVIIHSTDNYLSNSAMRILLSWDCDISALFKSIKEIAYAVVESGVEKISDNFPRGYYLSDDIDIFTKTEDLLKLSKMIESYCRKKYNHPWVEIENVHSDNGRRVKVLLKGEIILMFDLMITMPEMKREYIMELVSNSTGYIYKNLSIDQEFQCRLAKYMDQPKKKWHAEFIREHKDIKINESAFCDATRAKRILKEILK